MSTRIIADFCSNHLGDRRLMEHGIKVASETGIDIIKFQSFKADNLNKNWPDYENAYSYYKSVELSEEDHVFILEKCKQYGIEPLFTAFGFSQALRLKEAGLKMVKIGSAEAGDDALINYCWANFKQVIVSTGMIDNNRIRLLRNYDNIYLLYCVSKYPTKYEEIDFERMQLFDGFSDHTPDIKAAKKAIDLEMEYIERHFTLGKWLPGKDHFFSSTPDEFRELVDYRNYVEKSKLYKERWHG